MGFWSSFFGAGAAHVYNEMKKEGKETQKWNDLFHEMMECESAFNEYLKSVGIIDSYCADVEYVNSGNIMPIKRDLENLREKVNNYISLGGLGVCVRSLESLDDDVEKVKYLKKVGKLERQVEFAYDDMRTVKDKIEAEQEEIEYQQERLREEQQEQRRQEINNIVGTDINSLSGEEFELICQKLVENMGFETETTKASGDGGIDLIAYNHQPLLSGKYLIQCKRYSGSVGEPIIRDLYGVVMSERANKGILMTTGYFTKSAIAFAEGKPIELIDGERLSDLLQQYNLVYENIDGLEEEIEEPFNPQEFLGYYYSIYEELQDIVKRDAGDIRSRCLLVEVIHTAIKMRLNLFDLGDDGTYILKTDDIQNMINILGEYLQPLIRNNNSRSTNKKLQYIYYMSLLIDGECSIMKGDFVNAVEKYGKVLNEWKELDKGNELLKVDLVYSLFAIFRLFDKQELIDKYYNMYRSHIEDWKKFYSESTINKDFHENQLKKLQNKYNVTEYVAFTLYDTSDDEVSVLYDKGIDDWGEIQISFSAAVIDVNSEKNYLYFDSENTWKKRKQQTVLVKNIQSVIEKQKPLI